MLRLTLSIRSTPDAGDDSATQSLVSIKGKTLYNPGMLTAIVLFLPLSIYFFPG